MGSALSLEELNYETPTYHHHSFPSQQQVSRSKIYFWNLPSSKQQITCLNVGDEATTNNEWAFKINLTSVNKQ